MDETTAILFPGQGSQRDGMDELVRAAVPDLFDLATSELGDDLFARAAEGTRFAQPAILCAGLASWTLAGRPAVDALAGHSLGELGAAVAADAIAAEDAVRLAVQRGALMGEAAEAEAGDMLALLCPIAVATEVGAASGTVVANDNDPTQVVLSGPERAIERAADEAAERGVRTLPLPVTGAFHSPAMRPAYEPFRALLEEVEVRRAATPLISSTTVRVLESPDEIRDGLARAIVEPVRWRETIIELHRRGVSCFLETGPGKALTGMVRRTLDGVTAKVLEAPEPQPRVKDGVARG